MMDKSSLSRITSRKRTRQLLGFAIVLFGLSLSGPCYLWGDQCSQNPSYVGGSVTISPGTIIGGSSDHVTATITLNGVAGPYPFMAGPFFYISDVSASPQSDYAYITTCTSSVSFPITAGTVTTATVGTLHVTLSGYNLTASFLVLPSGQAVPPATLGPCKQCQQQGGQPINLTTGNVWIPQRDYSVPGLGGGVQLSRVWNSLWTYAQLPPGFAGTFGFGWQSTYEERLTGPDSNNNLIYWRGDGVGWTFHYNSVLSTYTLVAPPDERAQLVTNLAGGFTLTLADRTQRVFNSADLLTTIIDRNLNQTSIAYDNLSRISTVTSPGGTVLTFSYSDTANPMQATTVQDVVGTIAT